ncbi:MAG: hypothetical protein ABIO67_01190, partial [Mycobacteriales bacterium]
PALLTTTGTAQTPAQWTYAGSPLISDVDQVRFWLQDTDPAMPLIADLELQFLVDEWYSKYDSLIYVAAVAADRVSAKFAGVVNVNADGVSVNVSDLADRYAALAARLRQTYKDAQVGGEVDIANLMWDQFPDYGIKPLSFGVGMHDNLDAGRQDYGSGRYNSGSYEDTVRPGG